MTTKKIETISHHFSRCKSEPFERQYSNSGARICWGQNFWWFRLQLFSRFKYQSLQFDEFPWSRGLTFSRAFMLSLYISSNRNLIWYFYNNVFVDLFTVFNWPTDCKELLMNRVTAIRYRQFCQDLLSRTKVFLTNLGSSSGF